jgi:uncharacterized protein (DUF1800 family)
MGVQGRAAVARRVLLVTFLASAGVAADAQRRASGVPARPDDQTIVHVLNRIGFGPRPGDVARVKEMGLAAYLDRQLNPASIPDAAMSTRLAGFKTVTMSTRDLARDYYIPGLMARREAQRAQAAAAAKDPEMRMTPEPPAAAGRQGERLVLMELAGQKVLRAAYSERQLEEVMVDFWFNHFNVFAGKGQTRMYLTEYERDAIRPRVFGKFRDLLGAVAESPAMLWYLDNFQSSAPEGVETMGRRPGRQGRGALRRPVVQPPQQNRRRGINENYARELMELHTLGVDGGYTQKDVQEVARAFTGWTIDSPRQGGSFRFEPRMHDNGEKTVLGVRIKAGGGKHDGEQVLDILAKHPSTARFISAKLARRFVADEPPPSLVDRAAARFRDTDGDIREVVRTIITSPEFFSASARRAKVKTPFEFVISAVRATGAELADGLPTANALRTLGMPLYGCQPPTGYSDRADAWVNTGALLNRMNFAVSLSNGGGGGRGRRAQAAAGPVQITADQISREVLAGEVAATTVATVARATSEPQRIALLLGSPDFQKR